MDNRPIGVFDSGLGGLTAMRELIRTLPNENILYFGDTGRVPYGSRGREIIRKYAKQDMNFLIRHDVKAVLAACGTVSSVARDIGDALPVPYFDVLRPTARAAVEQTKNGKIGIIGTAATIASGSYRKEIERLAPKTEVFEQACPLFVPLVENAFVSPDDPIPRLTAERYLTPIREAGVDTLILGCTHYPIISETIRRVMGENVTLISSGREAAKSCRTVLEENGLLCDGKTDGTQQYFVSDDTESFYKVAELFLGQSVESCVECIDIERYCVIMREDYEITIIGRQTIDAQTDEIQVDTLGDYTERGGAKYISYTEYADEAPYNGQLKVLKIENEDTVTMLTPGTPTRLVLEKGKRHKCLYDTGAGVLSLGVYTQTLKHDLSAAGGELCIRYTLDIDTQLSSSNEICVRLRKRDLFNK